MMASMALVTALGDRKTELRRLLGVLLARNVARDAVTNAFRLDIREFGDDFLVVLEIRSERLRVSLHEDATRFLDVGRFDGHWCHNVAGTAFKMIRLVVSSDSRNLRGYHSHGANAAGADAIFVGHRGLSEEREAVVGSVAKEVLSKATVPVTVVR
jgi:hypothetical protein